MKPLLLTKSSGSALALVAFALILMPKINLIDVSGQSAGIRVDDIVIAVYFFIFFSFFVGRSSIPTLGVVGARYLWFCALSLLFTLFNIYQFGNGSVLYPTRLIEYSIFFLVGTYVPSIRMARIFLFTFLTINSILVLLQLKGIAGGFSSEGFNFNATTRPIGTTGGPWELSAVTNLICCYLTLRGEEFKRPLYCFLILAWTTALVLLTASRISLLAQLIIIVLLLVRQGAQVKHLFMGVIFAGTIFAIIMQAGFFAGVYERSIDLASATNIYAFMDYYNNLGVLGASVEFPDLETVVGADASWLYRVSKWTFVIKYWQGSLFYMLFGVGAGVWGWALDGGALRLITENGAICAVLYLLFLFSAARMSYCAMAMVLAFSVNMLMIDIYIAYKFMAVLLLLLGLEYRAMRPNEVRSEDLGN